MKRKLLKYKKTRRTVSKQAPPEIPITTQLRQPGAVLPTYRCKFCHQTWIPRINRPDQCPYCKRRNWY